MTKRGRKRFNPFIKNLKNWFSDFWSPKPNNPSLGGGSSAWCNGDFNAWCRANGANKALFIWGVIHLESDREKTGTYFRNQFNLCFWVWTKYLPINEPEKILKYRYIVPIFQFRILNCYGKKSCYIKRLPNYIVTRRLIGVIQFFLSQNMSLGHRASCFQVLLWPFFTSQFRSTFR